MLKLQNELAAWRQAHASDSCFVAATAHIEAAPAVVSCALDDSWRLKLCKHCLAQAPLNPSSSDAIRLTNCELASAGVPVPRECEILQHEHSAHPTRLTDTLTECTKAFARIPQLWTSYSTTTKHVQLLCQSLRHDAERDRVIEFYRNMSSAQLANHELLLEHAAHFAEFRANHAEGFEKMNEAQQSVFAAIGSSRVLLDALEGKMQAFLESLAVDQEFLTQGVNLFRRSATSLTSDLTAAFQNIQQGAEQASVLQEQNVGAQVEFLKFLNEAFSRLKFDIQSHESSIASVAKEFNQDLQQLQDQLQQVLVLGDFVLETQKIAVKELMAVSDSNLEILNKRFMDIGAEADNTLNNFNFFLAKMHLFESVFIEVHSKIISNMEELSISSEEALSLHESAVRFVVFVFW
ncbi:hypothetical protein HDU82_007739 [Entophlyctis luteolus]|nr:hypothetical protein HDU82_007739 [Entophlyctis luteolus]